MTALTGWEFLRDGSAMRDRMNQVQTPSVPFQSYGREGGIDRLPRVKSLRVLCCCVNGDPMEGRAHNVRGFNRGCSFDKSCHRLQHFGVRIGVVSVGAGFVVPQAYGSHIASAGAGECNFVLKAVLLAKQRKNLLVKRSGVIRKHIGLQMKRNITSKHMSTLLRLSVAKIRENFRWADLVQET